MNQMIGGEEIASCENCRYWNKRDPVEGICRKTELYTDDDDICHQWEPTVQYLKKNDRSGK